MSPLLKVFLAGLIGAMAMAPFHFLPALVFSLSYCVYTLLNSPSAARTAVIGYVYGFGYFLGGLWWISNALLVNIDQFWWVWPLALVGLPAILAIFPSVMLHEAHRFINTNSVPARWMGFTTAIMVAEFLRSILFTGFPWNLFGMVWLSDLGLPLAQTASLFGIYGLTFITIQLCALPALYWFIQRERLVKIEVLCFTVLAVLYGYGFVQLQKNVPVTDYKIAVVQANETVSDAWDKDRAGQKFSEKNALTRQALGSGAQLVIWPETSTSAVQMDVFVSQKNELSATMAQHPNARLITGYFYEENGYHNALASFAAGQDKPVPFYSKHHLVPFGEYIPFEDKLPFKPITGYSGFQAGTPADTMTLPNVPPFRPLICYEIIFPQYSFRKKDEWILTVADDSWYGNSTGPHQHLAQARMRAIEQGLPVIRSTSNGISALIDPYGRIVNSLPYNHSGNMIVQLPQAITSIGLYSQFGNLFLYVYFSIMCLIIRIKMRLSP